jgi:hypothetical protein
MSLHTNAAIDQVHFVPSVESLHVPQVASVPFICSVEEIFTSGLEQQNFSYSPTGGFSTILSFCFWPLENIGGGVGIGQNWQGFVKWFDSIHFLGTLLPLNFE